jgi:hypothetical protein
MKEVFTIPALISKFVTLSDGTVRIYIDTNELCDEQKLGIFKVLQKFCFIGIKEGENDLTAEELEFLSNMEKDDTESGKKRTRSQKLRDCFYISWQHDRKGFEHFDDYYAHRMDKLITMTV